MNLNFLSLIAALAGAANLLLGFYVWVNGPRTRLRGLFFGMAFLQAVWCFIGVILFSAPDHEAFMTWYRAGSPFYITYYPLTLHFFLEFTGSIRHRAVLLPVLYLPAVVIVAGFLTDASSIQIFERQGEFWTFTFNTNWLYCLYMAYFFSCFWVALLLSSGTPGRQSTRRRLCSSRSPSSRPGPAGGRAPRFGRLLLPGLAPIDFSYGPSASPGQSCAINCFQSQARSSAGGRLCIEEPLCFST